MAKRSASSELNHENWNLDDEKEDPGHFTVAKGEQLKTRVFRKAKRSLNSSSSSPHQSPFTTFAGFTSTSSGSSPFGSFTKTENSNFSSPFSLPKSDTQKPNGNFILNQETKSTNVTAASEKPNSTSDSSNPKTQAKQTRGIDYYRQLQTLNEGVLKWMQIHLAKNACCDFTPVFNDYSRHMDTLNLTYPVLSKKENNTSSSETKDSDNSKAGYGCNKDNMDSRDPHSAAQKKNTDDETDYGAHFNSNTTNTSTFSFGIKRTPTATSSNTPSGPTSSSQQGANQDNDNEKKNANEFQMSGFFSKAYQSTTDKPFSFATNAVAKPDAEAQGEVEYEPPKPDFVAVSEDALYSKRCKMFFRKGEGYADRGVGTLHLKKLEDKTQLLIRADTSLGNILLNVMLSASLPISRTGKNNVLLVCIPNPPVDAKDPDTKTAIPILIRVKTSEDADELLENLNKYKS